MLFNHASKIEAYDLPSGSEVTISHGWGPPDDYDDTISIFETVPKPAERSAAANIFELNFGTPADFISMPGRRPIVDSRATSLRMDVSSIQVFEIRGVSYEKLERNVERHRREKSDGPEPF